MDRSAREFAIGERGTEDGQRQAVGVGYQVRDRDSGSEIELSRYTFEDCDAHPRRRAFPLPSRRRPASSRQAAGPSASGSCNTICERTPVLMGVMSAFVFAAQMVNFPLFPLPISGHLLGGVLSAVLLGPWAGAVVIAAVLIVQCLLFGDGGVTAIGANFVNMGLIGSIGGYADLCGASPGDGRPGRHPRRRHGGVVLSAPGIGSVCS